MAHEKKRKKGQKLTDGVEYCDNLEVRGLKAHLLPADPRIIAFVRMLARKAAERDYARYVRRNGTTHNDLPDEE